MSRRALPAVARLLCALASASLGAGGARADGNGVLVGDSARLHLGFESEARFDSLAAQGGVGDSATPDFNPSDVIMHFRPNFKLLAPGAKLDFEGLGQLDYSYFTGSFGQTRRLSYLGALVGARLEMGKSGPVGLVVADRFSRSDRTTNPALGLGSLTDSNSLDARLGIRPGGGALEFGLGYAFALESYELHSAGAVTCTEASCDGTRYGGFGSQTHRFSLDGRWRFLPKTAFVLDASYAARLYENSTANVNSSPLRVQGGLAGLLTEKIRLVLKAGYENTFAASGANFGGVIGQAELGWTPTDTASLTVGLLRTVEPVSDVYGWFDDWRAYADGRLLLAGQMQLVLAGSVDRIAFGGGNGRIDTQARLDASVELELFRPLRGSLGAALTTRDSTEGSVFVFQRGEIYLRLSFVY